MSRAAAKKKTARKPARARKLPNVDPVDPEVARRIEQMATVGVPQAQIAVIERMDPKTLMKRYGASFSRGKAMGDVNIAQSVFVQTVGRAAEYDAENRLIREEVKPDKSVAIFMSKVRLGYRDVQVREVKLAFDPAKDLDLSALTSEELQLVLQLLQKAKQRAAPSASE